MAEIFAFFDQSICEFGKTMISISSHETAEWFSKIAISPYLRYENSGLTFQENIFRFERSKISCTFCEPFDEIILCVIFTIFWKSEIIHYSAIKNILKILFSVYSNKNFSVDVSFKNQTYTKIMSDILFCDIFNNKDIIFM
jgi:hypothetical protein